MTNLHEGGVYSELTNDSMKDVICDYLAKEYNKRLNSLSIKFDLRLLAGEQLDQSDYDKEFAKLKDDLTELMDEIARIK